MSSWTALRLFLSVCLVLFGGWYLLNHSESIQLPSAVDWRWFFLAVLCQIPVSFGNTKFASEQLKEHGKQVSLVGLWHVNSWGALVNLFLPLGLGVFLRGAWLYKRYRLPKVQVAHHIMKTNYVMLATNLWLLALFGALYYSEYKWPFVLALIVLAILMGRQWGRMVHYSILPYPFIVAGLVAMDSAFNVNAPILFLVLIPLAMHVSAVIVLAPGSLATTEALYLGLALMFGLPASGALWLALGQRLASIVAIASLLCVFWIIRNGKSEAGDPPVSASE